MNLIKHSEDIALQRLKSERKKLSLAYVKEESKIKRDRIDVQVEKITKQIEKLTNAKKR